MPPRRSHKKSRTGCKRCKARKIKCDEIHPQCGNCLRHGVPCDFEHPDVIRELRAMQQPISSSSSSSNALASSGFAVRHVSPSLAIPLYRQPRTTVSIAASSPVGRMTELRLMHQYTHFTYKTLALTDPEAEHLWGSSVPGLAFAGNPQLMDAILAIAALHIRAYSPNDKEIVRASHAYTASCINAYTASLANGLDAANATSMFITGSLIALQSTASRIFTTKDERVLAMGSTGFSGPYQPPLAWFYTFQGIKTVVATSWPWLKQSDMILTIINAQPVLNLNFTRASDGFFGHLLQDLDDEIAAVYPYATAADGAPLGETALATSTRQAYQHAVAMLNWAHQNPGKGVLAFPATVSKRLVELVEERQPRALAILASFFALLKVLDHVWWLQGMARREVLGVVSLFHSDYFGPQVEKKWWPHLEWAVRIALYDTGQNGHHYIPADVWGSAWDAGGEEQVAEVHFTSHIDLLSHEFALRNMDDPRAPCPLPPSPDNT